MDDMSVSGANQLAALTRRLKESGNTGLRRDLLRGLRNAAQPLTQAARESARERLPKHGGLNEVVAGSKFAVRTRASGRNPGVRIVGVSPHHLASLNSGRLRHPTFGRDPWVTQQIPPGWWSDPMKAGVPHVRDALVAVIAETARKIEGH